MPDMAPAVEQSQHVADSAARCNILTFLQVLVLESDSLF
jgi:hypothetical protein